MKTRRRYLRYAAVTLLVFLFLAGTAIVVTYQVFTTELPNIETVKDYRPCVLSRVFDADGEVIGEFFIEKRELVPLERVPLELRQALIAAEDANFYRHEGLDFFGILRAMLKNIRAGEIVQGGSTITQQVVKSLLLTPERSWRRKIREAILANRLERSLSKDEILYLYLNQIYFGHGAYGVQMAAQSYFGHDVSEVDLAEAALLAGLPQAPSRYSPARHPERARERQRYVLARMVEEGMITPKEMEDALALEKHLAVLPLVNRNLETAPYFIDYVREYLKDRYGEDLTFCGGLRVYTTLRAEEQRAAREAVQFGVGAYWKRHPDEAQAVDAENPLQGALLAMDLPSGAIRAMVGGVDYAKSKFNRTTQSHRQPGSAVKPLIYAAALDKGYTPATLVVDSPMVFEDPVLEEKWKPKNYSRRFVGPTTLRDALTHSRNVVTIKILRDIGVPYAIRYARKLGVSSHLSPDLSLALGSSEVTLQELLVAYSTFAMGGARPRPMFIRKITDAQGKVLEEQEPSHEQVLSPQTAYLMTSLLRGVVLEGTGRAVRSLQAKAAGKTGTTNEYRDAWFVGYTPDKIAGVWLGFDQPKNLGKRESGGRAAAPVWLEYMKQVYPNGSRKTFPVPPGIVFARIDTETGLLATDRTRKTRLECFREGTEPQEFYEEAGDQDEADFFKEELDAIVESPPSPESNGDGGEEPPGAPEP